MVDYRFKYSEPDHERELVNWSRLRTALKNKQFSCVFNDLKYALRKLFFPETVNEDYLSAFSLWEKDVQVEHTIPLGNLLLHTEHGRIVGIEIFERANEILGTWKLHDGEDVRMPSGRWFMQQGEGVYSNKSGAVIEAEDEGCSDCGGNSFVEERIRLNKDKELVIAVKCEKCGLVFDTIKR